jgi:hypothetical protein
MTASTDNGQDTISKAVRKENSEYSGRSRASVGHRLEPTIEQLAEFREYLLHYLEAHKDKAKVVVRRLILRSVILISLVIAWVAALAAGAILLVYGMGEAAGIAIGNRSWAGHLVVGGSVVMSTLLVIVVLAVWSSRSARQRTIHKYERRHRIQRARFGRTVKRRSAS